MMDAPQKQLFGTFPRSVGSPDQHIVHSESEFDSWAEVVQGHRNAYSSLSWFPPNGGVMCDKVSLDLDAAAKDTFWPDGTPATAKIEDMRDDDATAQEVLGEVCREARVLARDALPDFPLLGVFSGFGIHLHFLTEPQQSPGEHMGTTARYLREEHDLATLDHKPIGDEQRIMRVPNMQRVHHDADGPPYEVHEPCDLFTIPLTRDELATTSPQSLLAAAWGKRPDVTVGADERPPMPFYEDYTRDSGHAMTARPDRPSIEGELSDEGVEWYVQELLQMPCMYENLLLDPEPPHEIRVNATVMLFNLGLGPAEVINLFSQLGWVDWDREVTTKQVRHIYQKGYSDMSCATLRKEGYCTRSDDPTDCETYGWSGGTCEWR